MYKNKLCGIYKISSVSHPDRYYIGSSTDIKHRWENHRGALRKNKHHSPKLQRHVNKYGIGDLLFEIIERIDVISKENIEQREQVYLDTLKPTWNVCSNAYTCLGVKRSATARENYSRGLKGIPKSEEAKRKLSETKKNDPRTMDQITRLAEINKGNKYCLGNSWNKGKKRSPESIEKGASKMRGRKKTPEAIENTRRGLLKYYETHESPKKGTKQTEEQIKHNSEAQLEWHKTHVSPSKGRRHSLETRKKMSLRKKGQGFSREAIAKSNETKRKKCVLKKLLRITQALLDAKNNPQ